MKKNVVKSCFVKLNCDCYEFAKLELKSTQSRGTETGASFEVKRREVDSEECGISAECQ